MKLVEILAAREWPYRAEYAYQSAVDSEIYYFDRFDEISYRTYRHTNILAEDRGPMNRVFKNTVDNHIKATRFIDKMKEAGGPNAIKKDERERMIKRIENGLRKDFDIDSREFAELMFDNGWRK
ncbi:MAG: hypothetical protein [Caudoviricetes sp.]|nr:MAG: hypothetical protein [Caudoviricetes sp.]